MSYAKSEAVIASFVQIVDMDMTSYGVTPSPTLQFLSFLYFGMVCCISKNLYNSVRHSKSVDLLLQQMQSDKNINQVNGRT